MHEKENQPRIGNVFTLMSRNLKAALETPPDKRVRHGATKIVDTPEANSNEPE
jgi:hypothetical protein